MTETTGEVKLTKSPFEENAYKYADEQAELYRGLKEPSGGYANIVDAYIAGAKIETAELEKEIARLTTNEKSLLAERKIIVKENTELKARLNAINLLTPELEKKSKLRRQQLTNAKEIIKDLLSSCFGYNSKTVNYEVKTRAEQFLKEE